ncbi:hypothetical protein BTVI_124720 [Pitangus sulphuratus]|nr:hypothetical protein BTVI_124720 [Pitangus sulphuratus]
MQRDMAETKLMVFQIVPKSTAHRQHSTTPGRVIPDLLKTPILIITASVHSITSLSCGWDTPILSIPLVLTPGTAKQESAYVAEKPLAKPEGDVVETSKDAAGEMEKSNGDDNYDGSDEDDEEKDGHVVDY